MNLHVCPVRKSSVAGTLATLMDRGRNHFRNVVLGATSLSQPSGAAQSSSRRVAIVVRPDTGSRHPCQPNRRLVLVGY